MCMWVENLVLTGQGLWQGATPARQVSDHCLDQVLRTNQEAGTLRYLPPVLSRAYFLFCVSAFHAAESLPLGTIRSPKGKARPSGVKRF